MSEILEPPVTASPTPRIAVMCPDAGIDAAYVAAALARRLVPPGRTEGEASVVLIDGRPGAGGLDVILDLETAPGARWPAMRGAGLEIDAEKLLRALPTRDAVAVLSHGRRAEAIDEAVQLATCGALAGVTSAVVMTATPNDPPTPLTADVFLLLVRGTVASMAAAECVVQGLDDDLPCGVLVVEADSRTRLAIGEALAVPVVAWASPRWLLGAQCARDVLCGRWPGQSDRAMRALLDGAVQFVASREGSLTWA